MPVLDRDDTAINPNVNSDNLNLANLIETRISRRNMLAGIGTAAIVTACKPLAKIEAVETRTLRKGASTNSPNFTFSEITRGTDRTHHVPKGYKVDVLLRWGDPIYADAPVFNPLAHGVLI